MKRGEKQENKEVQWCDTSRDHHKQLTPMEQAQGVDLELNRINQNSLWYLS